MQLYSYAVSSQAANNASFRILSFLSSSWSGESSRASEKRPVPLHACLLVPAGACAPFSAVSPPVSMPPVSDGIRRDEATPLNPATPRELRIRPERYPYNSFRLAALPACLISNLESELQRPEAQSSSLHFGNAKSVTTDDHTFRALQRVTAGLRDHARLAGTPPLRPLLVK